MSEHLKNRQIDLGISQAHMAKLLKVSEESVTSWYHGKTQPPIKFCPRIINFLGYNPYPFEGISIGGQIKNYRTLKGLSFRNLSKITGFDPATLARWEKNMTAPNTQQKMALAGIDIIK